jgi:hypothetical protein
VPVIYYLDSNAWVNFGRYEIAYRTLANSHLSGELRVLVLQQNIDELLDELKVSPINLETNKKLLLPFLAGEIEDSIFILGTSNLDSALFASEEATSIFDEHLMGKKASLQGIRDGIHLSNSLETGSVLVSCDRQVRGTAYLRHIPILCVSEFSRIAKLGEVVMCAGCNA